MANGGHTALGSGLTVADGAGYSSPQRPSANPLAGGGWRAEIAGVENGAVVRSWVGKTYPTKAEALSAAVASGQTPGGNETFKGPTS